MPKFESERKMCQELRYLYEKVLNSKKITNSAGQIKYRALQKKLVRKNVR